MKIRDLMTPDTVLCTEEDTLSHVAQLMAERGIGSVPVGRGDRLVGMVTDRDIVVRGLARSADPAAVTAGAVMQAPVLYCFDDQEVDEVSASMGRNQVRRMPVVDREKRLLGFVSLGDLMRGGAPEAAAEADHAILQG